MHESEAPDHAADHTRPIQPTLPHTRQLGLAASMPVNDRLQCAVGAYSKTLDLGNLPGATGDHDYTSELVDGRRQPELTPQGGARSASALLAAPPA
eukprot:770254-Prymnesium_polylepis.1